MSAQSARGLFRATGKQTASVVVKAGSDLAGAYESADGLPREANDFYPTPSDPTLALMHRERDAIHRSLIAGKSVSMPIWEPACGDGAMVRDIQSCGFPCTGSDLVCRGAGAQIQDFFSFTEETAPSNVIITNPPFSAVNWRDGKGRWITHAMDTLRAQYMALLLSWSWPGAGGLAGVWHQHPPTRVYLMRWKIDFTGQGAPPMLNGWFVWDAWHQGPTELHMMDRSDAAQALSPQMI